MQNLIKITKNREDLFLPPLTNPATGHFSRELEERSINQAEAARSMKVDKQIINALVNQRRDLSADLAMRIEQFPGIRAALLLQVQTDYKLKKAQREKADLIKKEVSPHAA